MVARRRREKNDRNNKKMLKILAFIRILCLKQQSNILRCFCSLKFGKKLIQSKFFSFIFHSTMIAYTAENGQIKYFAQN